MTQSQYQYILRQAIESLQKTIAMLMQLIDKEPNDTKRKKYKSKAKQQIEDLVDKYLK